MAHCQSGSPGPAYAFGNLTGYNNHDFTKSRAPAYSLGLKGPYHPPEKTPGPYNVGKVDRNGKLPYVGWTMESKAATKVRPFGPGPLDYAPEKMPYYTPAYSLGLKLGTKTKPFGPSPADYFPQNSETGPAYSIASARRDRKRFAAPGPLPATPLDKYKTKAPAYSLGLKGAIASKPPAGPGPIYMPGRVCRHHVPHAYSFGLKHSQCAPVLMTREDMDET